MKIIGYVLTVNKRKFCDAGCGYDKAMTKATPEPKATHQRLESTWSELVFPQPPFVKDHKHHFVRESWIEVVSNDNN